MWHFAPSVAASAVFLALFFVTTVVHIVQAFRYRQSYCWVIVMSGIWQTLTYIFHTASVQVPDGYSLYAAWFVLILMAPLWTNAFVYMLFGRIVWNFTSSKRVGWLKARHVGVFFVILDLIAFIIQVYGAARATTKNAPQDIMYQGLHIYMGGVSAQLFFILIFVAFASHLFRSTWRSRHEDGNEADARTCLTLLWIQGAVLLLITVRISF